MAVIEQAGRAQRQEFELVIEVLLLPEMSRDERA